MKKIGICLLIIGASWGLVAFNKDTTVETESHHIGDTYIPSQKVHNIGLMEDRRNHLMLAGLAIMGGIILFGFGSNSSKQSSQLLPERVCPYCAESIKIEAQVCKHCGKDIPTETLATQESQKPIDFFERPPHMTFEDWQNGLIRKNGVIAIGSTYYWKGESYNSFAQVVEAMKLQQSA